MAYDNEVKRFSVTFHGVCLGVFILFSARIGFTKSALFVSRVFTALFFLGHVYLLLLFVFSVGDVLLQYEKRYLLLPKLLATCLSNLRNGFLYFVLMRLSAIMEMIYSWFYIIQMFSFIFLVLDCFLLWVLCISRFLSPSSIPVYYNYITYHSIASALIFILFAVFATSQICRAASRFFLLTLNLIAFGFLCRALCNICPLLYDDVNEYLSMILNLCSMTILPISYILFMVSISHYTERPLRREYKSTPQSATLSSPSSIS